MNIDESELKIRRPKDMIPTVEVNVNALPAEADPYGPFIEQVLAKAAARSEKLRASIYVYQGQSVNFFKPTWSAFFGVAGSMKLLEQIERAFEEIGTEDVRMSDYIHMSMGPCEFHIESGKVWRPLEPGRWYSVE